MPNRIYQRKSESDRKSTSAPKNQNEEKKNKCFLKRSKTLTRVSSRIGSQIELKKCMKVEEKKPKIEDRFAMFHGQERDVAVYLADIDDFQLLTD